MNKYLAILALSCLFVTFQNCSGAEFGSNVQFEAIDKTNPGDGSVDPDDPADDADDPTNDTPPGDDNDAPGSTPTPTPAPPGVNPTPAPECPGCKKKDPPGTPPRGNKDDPPGQCDGSGLVECQLASPSQKVVLSETFQQGSNTRRTRVCMSENACLVLLNAYTAERGCSLSKGAATTPGATAQCTEIFPGSKGTCKNAAVVTDEGLSAILTTMGAP
ncbi:MAG: hypothetical protein ABL958_13480 [Bdellovibrionia bacterium]